MRKVFVTLFIVCVSGGTAIAELKKHALSEIVAPACEAIVKNANSYPKENTSKTTQYFTPLFEPGPDGGLQEKDRFNCVNMEGSCVVGDNVYDSDGKKYERSKVKFVFGMGSGKSDFNKTNSLFPCHTLAADRTVYRMGTVIFIPSFVGKICPQSGKPVNGCFVVGDVGHAITGKGRFDIFTGECANYDGKVHVCRDPENKAFDVKAGTEFRMIPRKSEAAYKLRSEFDAFVDNGWKP